MAFIDYLYFTMYRFASYLGGADREPEWGAAIMLALLPSTNLISILIVYEYHLGTDLIDRSVGIQLGSFAACFAIVYPAVLRSRRWTSIVRRCAEAPPRHKLIYSWLVWIYLAATVLGWFAEARIAWGG